MDTKGRAGEGLVAEFGRFVHRTSFDDLPCEVREMAKGRILDTLACCLAGRDLPPSPMVAHLAKESPGECTIFCYSHKTSMLDAAMTNGVMAHCTFQDDMIAGVAHPGSVVIPTAIAIAEREGASGKNLLLAIVLGYEVLWRVMKGTGQPTNPAFRPGTIFTSFGAATAAGKLMGLTETQLAHAIGYAASLTPGTPNEGWWGGTMEPIIEIGMTSRIGIMSALFARCGATAAPSVLEGSHGFFRCWSEKTERPPQLSGDLGQNFAILRTFIKPFAACGANQVPMQVATTLAKHRLKPKDILKIVERLRPGATDYAGLDHAGPYSSYVQALMSMQFCAAAAILGKPIDTPWFISEHCEDPEIVEVAARVELVCEEGRSLPRFEVYAADGGVLVAEEQTIDRSIHIPTTKNMQDKFRTMAEGYLDKSASQEIISLVMNMENIEDVRELTAALRR